MTEQDIRDFITAEIKQMRQAGEIALLVALVADEDLVEEGMWHARHRDKTKFTAINSAKAMLGMVRNGTWTRPKGLREHREQESKAREAQQLADKKAIANGVNKMLNQQDGGSGKLSSIVAYVEKDLRKPEPNPICDEHVEFTKMFITEAMEFMGLTEDDKDFWERQYVWMAVGDSLQAAKSLERYFLPEKLKHLNKLLEHLSISYQLR